MLRRVVGAAGVLAASVVLSGCSPEVLPLAAVAVDGEGTPRVLVRPCGAWSGDVEFPLFSPPVAWKAEARGEQRLLPGHTYAFVFYGHTDDQANGEVSFTAADLGRLERGEVWADDRVMGADEFEELAEGAC
ncbi:hypothetical protein [Streptomyces caniscabiei]|uniref:hypothetical protein n=1 Tax=Streptomyces caniscabiei TaxID=2746961 RepID=UPI000A3A7C40|nr:hypothetical protein [Streptomyces caniscabiei]